VDAVVGKLFAMELWWLQSQNPCCICNLDRLVDCYLDDMNVTAHVKRKQIIADRSINKENNLPEYFEVYICSYTTSRHITVYVRV
jgi:hypothetical protein